jgi:signal transduction histidine kinase
VNLLSNAFKYTDTGHVTVTARRVDDHIEIAVCDTGIGISATDLPHIFDEFLQVARKGQSALEGTGLGLAIVKRSIELLGGNVKAQSTEGKGTTFTLTLPDTA